MKRKIAKEEEKKYEDRTHKRKMVIRKRGEKEEKQKNKKIGQAEKKIQRTRLEIGNGE